MNKILKALSLILIASSAIAFTKKENNYCFYKMDYEHGTCPLTERPYWYAVWWTTGYDEFVKDENQDGSCDLEVSPLLCTYDIDTLND